MPLFKSLIEESLVVFIVNRWQHIIHNKNPPGKDSFPLITDNFIYFSFFMLKTIISMEMLL